MKDPFVYCLLSATEAAHNRNWLRNNRKSILEERVNGDIVLRFRASELEKLKVKS